MRTNNCTECDQPNTTANPTFPICNKCYNLVKETYYQEGIQEEALNHKQRSLLLAIVTFAIGFIIPIIYHSLTK